MVGSIFPSRALTSVWQTVARGGLGDEERAWLEGIQPSPTTRGMLACLWLAGGEPLRAFAQIEGAEPDEEDPFSLVAHACRSSLIGETERAREERAKLVALASRSVPERRLDLLLLAGWVAEEAGAPEEAAARFREVATARNLFSDWARVARALAASGEREAFVETVAALMERGDGPDDELVRLGEVCERAGEFERGFEIYERIVKGNRRSEAHERALAAATRLCIWKLALEEARAYLTQLERLGTREKETCLYRAMIELFEGRARSALAMLDDFGSRWSEARGLEYWTVRAEAALEAGRLEEARRSIDEAKLVETTFAILLVEARFRLVIGAISFSQARKLGMSSDTLWFQRRFVSRFRSFLRLAARIDPRLHSVLVPVKPELGAILAQFSGLLANEVNDDSGIAAAVVANLCAQLGGNRSSSPTRTVRTASGASGLEAWPIPPTDREASANLLRLLGRESPDEILRRFEQLIGKFPHSPYPFTYQGELRLWLGDYAGARQNFEAALRRSRARWAYVGLGAVAMLEGRTLRAKAHFAEVVARFSRLPSATTYVYRGELHRRMGDYESALRDLEVAVRYRPHRVGARMNLALTLAALGRHAEANDELRRAIALSPGIFQLAAEALSRPLPTKLDVDAVRPFIECALELMRGNRSSWMHTAFDKDGRFRVLPMATGWQALARRELVRLQRFAVREDREPAPVERPSGSSVESAA